MLARFWTTFCLLGILVFSASRGFSADTTVTLNAPSADATLFRSNPDNNLGRSDVVSGSTRQGEFSRGLIKFNIASQVPSNAVITSVTLRGQVVKIPASSPTGSPFGLHRLLVDWGEGTKGGNTGSAATQNESTWNVRFFPDTAWSEPGAAAPVDFNATVSSSVFINQLGAYTFPSTANLIADVQAWAANPASNFGWILISQSEDVSSTARRFGSKETGNAFRLTIVYHIAEPEPAPEPVIEVPTRAADDIQFRFPALARFDYHVEFVETLGAPWTTLTNIAGHLSDTNAVVRDSLTVPPSRFYRLRLTPR